MSDLISVDVIHEVIADLQRSERENRQLAERSARPKDRAFWGAYALGRGSAARQLSAVIAKGKS